MPITEEMYIEQNERISREKLERVENWKKAPHTMIHTLDFIRACYDLYTEDIQSAYTNDRDSINRGEVYYNIIRYLGNLYGNIIGSGAFMCNNNIVFCKDIVSSAIDAKKPLRIINLNSGIMQYISVDAKSGIKLCTEESKVPSSILHGDLIGINGDAVEGKYGICLQINSSYKLYNYSLIYGDGCDLKKSCRNVTPDEVYYENGKLHIMHPNSLLNLVDSITRVDYDKIKMLYNIALARFTSPTDLTTDQLQAVKDLVSFLCYEDLWYTYSSKGDEYLDDKNFVFELKSAIRLVLVTNTILKENDLTNDTFNCIRTDVDVNDYGILDLRDGVVERLSPSKIREALDLGLHIVGVTVEKDNIYLECHISGLEMFKYSDSYRIVKWKLNRYDSKE